MDVNSLFAGRKARKGKLGKPTKEEEEIREQAEKANRAGFGGQGEHEHWDDSDDEDGKDRKGLLQAKVLDIKEAAQQAKEEADANEKKNAFQWNVVSTKAEEPKKEVVAETKTEEVPEEPKKSVYRPPHLSANPRVAVDKKLNIKNDEAFPTLGTEVEKPKEQPKALYKAPRQLPARTATPEPTDKNVYRPPKITGPVMPVENKNVYKPPHVVNPAGVKPILPPDDKRPSDGSYRSAQREFGSTFGSRQQQPVAERANSNSFSSYDKRTQRIHDRSLQTTGHSEFQRATPSPTSAPSVATPPQENKNVYRPPHLRS